jgi:hypothetical protein
MGFFTAKSERADILDLAGSNHALSFGNIKLKIENLSAANLSGILVDRPLNT